MANGSPGRGVADDPYASFRFVVQIDQEEAGGFNEVTGLSMETSVETFHEGGVNLFERQLAGPTKFPSKLILKRGLAEERTFWRWYQDVMKGIIERKTIKITLQDYAGDPKWDWTFSMACPVKWTGPEFRAGRSEIAFESIELVHEGLQL